MDRLPNEILLKIFQNLYQVDQLLNCKTVCKKWYSTIHQMIRLNSLVISEISEISEIREINDYKILTEKWFDPNESLKSFYDYEDVGVSLKLIRFNMNQPLLSRLKKLFIYHTNIWINSINCLRDLEVLGLKSSQFSSKTVHSLNLPNLRVFSCVRNYYYDDLILNCPKLEKLALLEGFCNLTIDHPESIKEFHTLFIQSYLTDVLVNCEYFYVEWGYFNEGMLLIYKNLKELHDNRRDLEIINDFIRENSLKKTNLKIYHVNVLADSFSLPYIDQLDDSFDEPCINNSTIQFYGPNYSRLPNKIYFMHTVDYNVIENYFSDNPNQIAREIVKKFVHLNELILSEEIRDVNQFIGMLKDRMHFNIVRITAEVMPQNFFDQILSENCSIIEYLLVDNKNQLNFDFLLKFKELRCFHTNQRLTSDLIFKLFDKFELLGSLGFHYEGSEVRIVLNVRKKFKIRLDGVRKIFDNLVDLMSHLELNHHKTPFSTDDCFDTFIFNS